MKFRYLGEVEAKVFGGLMAKPGEIIEYEGYLADKADSVPEFERVTEDDVPEVAQVMEVPIPVMEPIMAESLSDYENIRKMRSILKEVVSVVPRSNADVVALYKEMYGNGR